MSKIQRQFLNAQLFSTFEFLECRNRTIDSKFLVESPVDWPPCVLVNYMKMVEFVGLSGPIKFDASGLRTQFVLSLMELQMPGLVGSKYDEFILFFISSWRNSSFSSYHPGATHPFLYIIQV